MIELAILAAVGASALAAGATAAVRRARRLRAAAEEARRGAVSAVRDARLEAPLGDAWIDVGDALVLDHGRGQTLSITRRWALSEVADAPFLVLLEADGTAAERALLAYDPLTNEAVAVLRPAGRSAQEALDAWARRSDARPADSILLDAPFDGRALRLCWRRPAKPRVATAEGADPAGTLPTPEEGTLWQVARYADALGLAALAVRLDDGELRVFAGPEHPAGELDVLRNRAS